MLAAGKNRGVQLQSTESLTDWRKIIVDNFGSTKITCAQPRFDASLARGSVDDLQVIHIKAEKCLVERRSLGKPPQTHGVIMVHLQLAGTSVNCQDSRLGLINPGEAVLCDPTRDYSIDFQAAYEMFVLKLPTAQLATRCGNVDPTQHTAVRLDINRSKLLRAFLDAAWAQRECLQDDADWRECVNETVVSLLARGILRGTESYPAASCSRLLRNAVLEHVRRHLKDPQLRTSTIAKSVGVTGRTVQSVFERMATTASAFILSERLRLATQRLRAGDQPITQIAMDLGFNDPSYFARCFHKRFNMSPRQYSLRR